MWPDRVSNPGPLTYKSGALPTALRDPADRTMETLRHKMFTIWKLIHLLFQCFLIVWFLIDKVDKHNNTVPAQ